MMRKLLFVLAFLLMSFSVSANDTRRTTLFLVEYESYTWDPCSPNGLCLAINCPPEGCYAAAQQFFVKTLGEVREIVDNNGVDHLIGMYRITYHTGSKTAEVIELDLVPSFTIEALK